MSDPILQAPNFPYISKKNYSKTSEETTEYNCIAHAFGDFSQPWWPAVDAYWPPGCPLVGSIESFHTMFLSLGYSECEDGKFENGVKKIALYALYGVPTHAARQVSKTKWTSKLGKYIDIEHTLRAIEGPAYGYVLKYYKK